MKLKILIIILAIIGLFFIWIIRENDDKVVSDIDTDNILEEKINKNENVNKSIISNPISDARDRITKKHFGIKISPDSSPVQPERFSGFHTGTDFEVMLEELEKEIAVYAICDGKVLQKSKIGGYGGVIVQKCSLKNQSVTIIYGHLSINKVLKNYFDAGEKIAILGKDKSEDTDGERKHLHLGIHKGGEINLRGYVNTEEKLKQWINIENYLNE